MKAKVFCFLFLQKTLLSPHPNLYDLRTWRPEKDKNWEENRIIKGHRVLKLLSLRPHLSGVNYHYEEKCAKRAVEEYWSLIARSGESLLNYILLLFPRSRVAHTHTTTNVLVN